MRRKTKIKIVALIIFLCIFSIMFSLINMGNDKIYSNIQIQGVSVAHMKQEEARNQLKTMYNKKKDNQLIVKHNDLELEISYDELDIKNNIDDMVEKAYSVGRNGNIITNNYVILSSIFFKRNYKLNMDYDEEKLNSKIDEIESKLPDVTKESSYYIEGDNLIIKKGTSGVRIKKDEFKNKIIQSINNFNIENAIIDIPVEETQPKEIDVSQIIKDTEKQAKDAYISENPTKIHAEEKGIEVAMSEDEINEILKEEKEEYTIPLKITEPSVTVASLGEQAFTDKLATFTTSYDPSNENRSNNLKLAAEKLNGTIVNPGETFSYNKTIGERTIQAGFKLAGAYAGGDVVLDVGGGICQLSSTLYNTALLSNLEIVERHNHSFQTSYVEAGRDATVSWGTLDFKFKNNRNYPIKIIAKADSGVVEVAIYGIKEENDPVIIIDSKVTEIIEKKTEYKEDNSLKKGEEVVERNGRDGCTSEATKETVVNGVVTSKEVISKDTYSPLSKVIRRNS